MKRIARRYDGAEPTGRLLKNLLPEVMTKIGQRAGTSQREILAAFLQIVGPEIGNMARISSFDRGVLTIKVMSPSLLDFLISYEKKRILERMREQFTKAVFKDIIFRIG